MTLLTFKNWLKLGIEEQNVLLNKSVIANEDLNKDVKMKNITKLNGLLQQHDFYFVYSDR